MALAVLSASTADGLTVLSRRSKHHTIRHDYFPRPGNDPDE